MTLYSFLLRKMETHSMNRRMNMAHFTIDTPAWEVINDYFPCEEGRVFAKDKTIGEAWDTCTYPNWLAWFIREAGSYRRLVPAITSAIRELAHRYGAYDKDFVVARACGDIENFHEGRGSIEDLVSSRLALTPLGRTTEPTPPRISGFICRVLKDMTYYQGEFMCDVEGFREEAPFLLTKAIYDMSAYIPHSDFTIVQSIRENIMLEAVLGDIK